MSTLAIEQRPANTPFWIHAGFNEYILDNRIDLLGDLANANAETMTFSPGLRNAYESFVNIINNQSETILLQADTNFQQSEALNSQANALDSTANALDSALQQLRAHPRHGWHGQDGDGGGSCERQMHPRVF